uniref:NADH-ubiquinone oxidoreductase chain 1 n=1 Tax=Nacolus tuberculatus TaxID=2800230 RepID=A0A7T7BYX4_9HEMI|nr:NADH dehydrogenase subunit 1 [Nacolus tuberculatus]QQK57721.1 NADH dehydrogenase subunit 1 [Nacolus tuberculatus]
MFYLVSLFFVVFLLISVGFFTLFERKILGYSQVRKGPCKVGFFGLLQPFSESEYFFPFNSNFLIYYFCPLLMFIQSFFLWLLFPYFVCCISFSFGLLFFMCCLSVSIYPIVLCGWSSNSIYSLLGGIRSVSQTISYEVSLSFFLLCYFLMADTYNIMDFFLVQSYCWFFFLSIPLFFCWLSCCLAETNRTPFDFSEGESELVSGFNIEYGGGGFAFLFISEYSSIIFMCFFTCMVFFGGDFFNLIFYFKIVLFIFFFVWVRCSFPRYRYDKLMYLAWSCYLPLSMNYVLFFFLISCWVLYHFFLLSY